MNALPPVPAVFGRRAGATSGGAASTTTPPWLLEWLAQPLDGADVAARLDPARPRRRRLRADELSDDADRRMGRRLPQQHVPHRRAVRTQRLPWRLVAGPWVHKSPSVARPGPNVDADAAIIAFFDEHLRDGPPSSRARGQVYVREPVTPEPDLSFHPGRWCDIDSWPTGHGRIEVLATPADDSGRRVDSLVVRGDVGWAAWNSCGGGLPWGQPLDQRDDNARSLVYDWVTDERVELAGAGQRTVDAFGPTSPTGSSARSCVMCSRTGPRRSSRAACSTSRTAGAGRPTRPARSAPYRGRWCPASGSMCASSSTPPPGRSQPGHVLRLAVAGTDWPNCWPPPGPVTLDVDATSVRVEVPVVDGLA